MGPCKYERHRWENQVNQILCFVFINERECPSINPFPCALQPSQQITSCVPAVPLSQNPGHPFMQWLLQPEVKGVFIVTLKYPIKVLWWIDIGNGERICLFIVIPGLGRQGAAVFHLHECSRVAVALGVPLSDAEDTLCSICIITLVFHKQFNSWIGQSS